METQISTEKIRNIAIIAHVDHGKTTLVDALLKQNNVFRENQEEMEQEQILDSGDLEKEKGITIKAKNVSIRYNEYKINIIDTPGHADFGGEVERTLSMADGCLLVVDAAEGPMPQTKFVLKRALGMGIKPIVVINKIDKKLAQPEDTLDKIQDLFLDLAIHEDQLDFPVFYAIARDGKVFDHLPSADEVADAPVDISPILNTVISYIPPTEAVTGDLQMLVTSTDYSDHHGRYLIGKVNRGTSSKGQSVALVNHDNTRIESGKIKALFVREGLDFVEVDSAQTGEIVAISGLNSAVIGATICDSNTIEPLPSIEISPPTLRMKFEANTSPFLGQEGEYVNYKQLQQRLERESENNISLVITKEDNGYMVAGRGELQLSILIETMRREGYEFQVRRPEVVYKKVDGKLHEPQEELIIETPIEFQSLITSALLTRRAQIMNVEDHGDSVRITSLINTSKLFGLRSEIVALAKNQAIMSSQVVEYVRVTGEDIRERNGALVSMAQGETIGYSLNTIQERGELLVGPSEKVYEGMIIGINKYEQDMEVNPTKGRQKSAVRMKHDEITQTQLRPIKPLTLEFAIVFLADDEILEVTPKSLRLRKELLTKSERQRARRGAK